MASNERATVRVEDLAYSNTLTVNALVELLDEKGILPKEEVLARIKGLGEEAGGVERRNAVRLRATCAVE